MARMTDHDWGALIARVLRFLWMLRWLTLSLVLLAMHKLLGTPWWLALLPPAYWYGRAWLLGLLVKWGRGASAPAPDSVSLKGSLLRKKSKK